MNRDSKRFLAALTAAAMILVGDGANVAAQEAVHGQPVDGESMSADLVMARPVGAAATVAGFALFVVSSPFSVLGGNSQEAWQSLVVAPASYTFQRPLGHFEHRHAPETTAPQPPKGKVYIPSP